MKHLLLAFYSIFFSTQIIAQIDTIYLDQYSNEVEKSEAKYYRIVSPYDEDRDSREIKDYYMNGKLYMSGLYSGNEKENKEGHFVLYYDNGLRSSEGEYKDGLMVGKWDSWYKNGQLKERRDLDVKAEDKEILMYFDNSPSAVLDYWDSLGNQLVFNGNGEYSDYYDNGSLSLQGELQKSKKEGEWIGYREDGDTAYKETYKGGRLIKGISFDLSGKAYGYLEHSTSPEPKKGMPALYKFINQNMKYPFKAKRKGIEGKVFVQFIVDKDGSIIEVKAVKGIGGGCDREAVRTIRNSPKWKPGVMRGQKVKVRMILPIMFKLS